MNCAISSRSSGGAKSTLIILHPLSHQTRNGKPFGISPARQPVQKGLHELPGWIIGLKMVADQAGRHALFRLSRTARTQVLQAAIKAFLCPGKARPGLPVDSGAFRVFPTNKACFGEEVGDAIFHLAYFEEDDQQVEQVVGDFIDEVSDADLEPLTTGQITQPN